MLKFTHMRYDVEMVNAVMGVVHTSANQIYECLIDGDSQELGVEIVSLIATLEAIKEENT